MKIFANLIIFSLMISMAILSEATTGLIDPTRPANYVESTTPVVSEKENGKNSDQVTGAGKERQFTQEVDFRLNAIKIGQSSRLAVINGETVLPGQNIGTAKLVKINSGSVVMNVDGRMITVSLLPDSIKKSVSK